jgi:tRNA(adenine34) deaminase
MCAGAVVQSRIARLVFGAWDLKAGACGSIFDIPAERRLNHHVEVTGGVLERESQTLLQNFFRPKRQGTASKHDHRAWLLSPPANLPLVRRSGRRPCC